MFLEYAPYLDFPILGRFEILVVYPTSEFVTSIDEAGMEILIEKLVFGEEILNSLIAVSKTLVARLAAHPQPPFWYLSVLVEQADRTLHRKDQKTYFPVGLRN